MKSDLCQAAIFFSAIFSSKLIQRILEAWERRRWPIRKCGEVKLDQWLAARGAQRAKQAAVKSALEAQHGQLGRARLLVAHARGQLILGEGDVAVFTAFKRLVSHKGGFEGGFVGAGAAHGGEDLQQLVRRHAEGTRREVERSAKTRQDKNRGGTDSHCPGQEERPP